MLFQEGVSDVFRAALEARNCRIVYFANDRARAQAVFMREREAEAIFFRANFILGESELRHLPQLRWACLVSTGSDNIDTAALAARGVTLVTGAGANAQAVFDYVVQALLFGGFDPRTHSVGIIGKGGIGTLLFDFLQRAHVDCAYYDPFMPDSGSKVAALACDYVTFHVPLTRGAEHPTSGMLDAAYFASIQKTVKLIQTSRGAIWNAEFYRKLAQHAHIRILAQDVYPTEPPNVEDISRAQFSTPHIAGYSTRGRLGGVLKCVQALFPDFDGSAFFPTGRTWRLDQESSLFAGRGREFNAIRDAYPWRKQFSEYSASEALAFRELFLRIPDSFFENLFAKPAAH